VNNNYLLNLFSTLNNPDHDNAAGLQNLAVYFFFNKDDHKIGKDRFRDLCTTTDTTKVVILNAGTYEC
jgi:hypothetical protein